ncbi:MAG: glycoside hydrolase family 27 protein [Terriglobales bacterium]
MNCKLLAFGALAAAGMLLAAQSAAPPLPGTWHAQETFSRRGHTTTLHLEYVFQLDGTHLSGVAASDRGRSGAIRGSLRGSQLNLQIYNPFSPYAAAQAAQGTLTRNQLTLTLGSRYGAPARTVVFTKVSDDTSYHLPVSLRHPPLPVFHPLPPNRLALTPPMGWNSWNHFASKVDDQKIRQTADLLVSTGMAAAGYVYVNIDDTWEGTRDAQGNIRSNAKFPDMQALAAYVHSRGLKLGIYSSPGPRTCAGYEGSYRHEAQDARTYAAWGIDYLKYDWCSASSVYTPQQMPAVYENMALALRATRRPMVFSLCEYGWDNVGVWGAAAGGNLWRTTDDIADNYPSMTFNGFSQNGRQFSAGPGHWNDPDMLEIGNGGMTAGEYRTHLSLWAMLAAPLLAGNDLTAMTPATLAILANKEVIAVDQDPLGQQGWMIAQRGDQEIWMRPLSGGASAVALFNRGTRPATMSVRWSALGLRSPATVRDLWAHRDLDAAQFFSANVPAHGVVMLRVQ